jgi:hypothetical protein
MRKSFGPLEKRILLAVPGTFWISRQPNKTNLPANRAELVRVDRIENRPISEWRFVFLYDGRSKPSNASGHSFFTTFKREDEEMLDLVAINSQSSEDTNRLILRFHQRLITMENYLTENLGYKKEE